MHVMVAAATLWTTQATPLEVVLTVAGEEGRPEPAVYVPPRYTDTWPRLVPKLVPVMVNKACVVAASRGATLDVAEMAVNARETPLTKLTRLGTTLAGGEPLIKTATVGLAPAATTVPQVI
jgi:hypothetical protein